MTKESLKVLQQLDQLTAEIDNTTSRCLTALGAHGIKAVLVMQLNETLNTATNMDVGGPQMVAILREVADTIERQEAERTELPTRDH